MKDKDPQWDVIHSVSRKDLIESGDLIQLSGPGYSGDAWVPDMVAEAGFVVPVAITAAAFYLTVELTSAANDSGCNVTGRLWDVLTMLRYAIKHHGDDDHLLFQVCCVTNNAFEPQPVTLKATIGPGDTEDPVITIMLPEED